MATALPQQLLAALQARAGSLPPGGGPAAAAAPSGPMAALAAMGGGGAPGPAGPGGDTNDAGNSFAAMLADLRGADPGMLVQQLRRMQQLMAVMAVHFLGSVPGAAGQMSKMVPQFDRIVKEAQQAAGVNAAVRSPIQMGAAQPSPQAQPQPSTGVPSTAPMVA